MINNGYILTDSKMLNNWILSYDRICIATKRGISGSPHFVWFTKGRDSYGRALTHMLHTELTSMVDIAWLGGPNKERLAAVTLDEREFLDVELVVNKRSLESHYVSFF